MKGLEGASARLRAVAQYLRDRRSMFEVARQVEQVALDKVGMPPAILGATLHSIAAELRTVSQKCSSCY